MQKGGGTDISARAAPQVTGWVSKTDRSPVCLIDGSAPMFVKPFAYKFTYIV